MRAILFALLVATAQGSEESDNADCAAAGTCGADVESLLQTRVNTAEEEASEENAAEENAAEESMQEEGELDDDALEKLGAGSVYYREIKDGNGRCLDVDRTHWNSNGGHVTTRACNTLSLPYEQQQWTLAWAGLIMNTGNRRRNSKCLDAGGSTQRARNGGTVHMWTCSVNNYNQKWQYIGGLIKNRHGVCLQASSYSGGRVHMWACRETTRQHWTLAGAPGLLHFDPTGIYGRRRRAGTTHPAGCGSGTAHGDKPCAKCQGDCDSDSDCAGNLKCFQRSSYSQEIPGCQTNGNFPWHDTTAWGTGNGVGWGNGATNAGHDYCYSEGDCTVPVMVALCNCAAGISACQRIRDGTCTMSDPLNCATQLLQCAPLDTPQHCKDQCQHHVNAFATNTGCVGSNINFGGGGLPSGYALGQTNDSTEAVAETETRKTKSEGAEDSLDESLSGKRTCE